MTCLNLAHLIIWAVKIKHVYKKSCFVFTLGTSTGYKRGASTGSSLILRALIYRGKTIERVLAIQPGENL
jgi:hypothetical protein